jgi:DHA2 family multidrug resistance protein-like MFS transporter
MMVLCLERNAKGMIINMEESSQGKNKFIVGIVLAVLTFWLFAQSMTNIIPVMQEDLGVTLGVLNISTSLTALFSGLFIVVAGGISDRSGRKKLTYIGLLLSIIGSLLLIVSSSATLLITARAIQGISAACIMPATLSLIRSNFEGKDRQRALSFWSFGSWGGGGLTAIVGGAIATYMGWRWIFIVSIAITLLSMYLIKDIKERKVEKVKKEKFDFTGFLIFMIAILMINIIVTRGQDFGWKSPLTVTLIAGAIAATILFFVVEKRKKEQFIDFSIFKVGAYTGSVVSNFFQNGIFATIVVTNMYGQMARGFTSFQTGLLTIGNVFAILFMIRVGEKMLQNMGARKPMLIGIVISTIGMSMSAMTFLPNLPYIVVTFTGFLIAGIGIGMYATPSIDTAIANIPNDKVGIASGIYKMASSLGYAFGLAITTAVFDVLLAGNIHFAASIGVLVNTIFAIIALIFIVKFVHRREGLEELGNSKMNKAIKA